ncbi:phosphate ABC transporter permease PstA [Adhaeretor mobilis]|uniref:Phosphate transport system permease protein PstA n=1 Tax=Adhaeretor mobilis TaxID=1930276 RepID=A0A517MZX7_9BACT|nr:phosphate ABC transporter permease PstA [Adhaeretor mobilis]QDT00437.1 Phosphate transport system permease protein PstA [Adhaeretor mobilis]
MSNSSPPVYRNSLAEHSNGRPLAKFASNAFAVACATCTIVCMATLVVLLWKIFQFGWGRVNLDFITSFPSSTAENAGIKSSLVGSLYLIGLTALFSVPLGVGTAIYLEEYCKPSRWRTFAQTNIANLAGVPSIVYGILGLGLFVRAMSLNRSLLAGALTLTLVILPIVILASQEALRAVPKTIRQASYALGATRWQTVWGQLLPASLPGILTGVILALSRALGEAAPLLAIGAATYTAFLPQDIVHDDFSVLPLQIYNWTDQPQEAFHQAAAAAIVVLLTVLICMNALAVFLRYRFSKRIQW